MRKIEAPKRRPLVQNIKNPWRKRKGVVVFDIETDWLEGRDEYDKRTAKFRCGVAYAYDEDAYYEFIRPKKFVDFLKKAKTLVTYNGEGFDFLVLSKYGLKLSFVKLPIAWQNLPYRVSFESYKNGWFRALDRFNNWQDRQKRWKPKGIKSFDIMHAIHENRPKWHKDKKYPSLEDMIHQHFGEHKTHHSHDDIEQLMRHCREDVEYTKQLYEEKTWKVPALERRGSLIGNVKNPLILCPMCEGKIIISDVNSSAIECRRCGRIVVIAPFPYWYSKDIAASIEEWGPICSNCRKDLVTIVRSHIGYGTKHGTIKRGRSRCPICRNGCYEWRNDNAPGFREHWRGVCCSCGKNIDRWKQRRAKVHKGILIQT
jgi:hypothetical protein